MAADEELSQGSAGEVPTEAVLSNSDPSEKAVGRETEKTIHMSGYHFQRVVGLGGSAGSLTALQKFFAEMPADSGMTFLVVLHLSPDHSSILAEILQRATTMPVVEVRDKEKTKSNRIYVIPPGKLLSLEDGRVRLNDLEPERGRRVTIDLFFRSLAETHGPRAVAIVLSGADGDGAVGIKRIKECGGLTVAQDPSEAEHDGMPRAAIATSMVDWVLPVAQMAGRLLDYQRLETRLQLPSEDGLLPIANKLDVKIDSEGAIGEVLGFLRMRTGHDFSYYKRATIIRRIARRMQVNGVVDLLAYLAFMRTHLGEVIALLQDLLISVTNFFRDRESFDAIETLVPTLFKGKGSKDAVRVWVVGCATGEEAYSLAMLLCEHAAQLEAPPGIQVFGTDLDEQAIQVARDGLYLGSISTDVSDQRLRRFFVKERLGYRVGREVREKVLFARHDLLRNAPFSRCDLLACRNLLIYLNNDAQGRALQIFHFALLPGGRLFLGSSESVDENSTLFSALDKKHRLYLRREVSKAALPASTLLSPLEQSLTAREHKEGSLIAGDAFIENVRLDLQPTLIRNVGEADNLSLSELHLRIIEHFAPPSVIVNEDYDILHLSEHAGLFLQFSAGKSTMNLLRLVQPMLRTELRAALFRAKQTSIPVEASGLPLDLQGVLNIVHIRVAPVRDLAPGLLLVTFNARVAAPDDATVKSEEQEPVVRHLENELDQIKLQLLDTIKQHETSSEELKASNEELHAINEELRAATEELETGREELQSVNEELITVNQELKDKVEKLDQANNDLQNLMASTDIATVFLDRDLRIMRYTPPAIRLFNLIPTDLGRPLSDLSNQMNYPQLVMDTANALETLSVIEREVWHTQSGYFLARLLPYRVGSEVAGVVVTLIDISQRKQAEEALRESERRFRAVADLVPDLLWSTDSNGSMLWVNHRWLEYTGQTLSRRRTSAGLTLCIRMIGNMPCGLLRRT